MNNGTGNPVDIVGVGSPVIAGNPALTLSDPTSTVSDLELQAGGTGDRTALTLTGTAERVTLSTTDASGLTTGVRMLGSSTLRDSVANLHLADGVHSDVAVSADAASSGDTMTIDGLRATADLGVLCSSPGSMVARHLTLFARGGVDVSEGVATLDDALIALNTDFSFSRAVNARTTGPGSGGTLTARHVTVFASNDQTDSDAFAASTSHAATASLTVSDSIAAGVTNALARSGQSGGTANLSIDYSSYDPTDVIESGMGAITGANNTSAAPGFVNAGAGDFTLAAASPLIDAGTPGALAVGEPATDLAGNPRIADGNGDGNARRDMGAFELPASPVAPTPPGPGAPSGGPGPAVVDGTAPSFVAASLARRRFAVGPDPTPLVAQRVARGTVFRYSLSDAATVRIAIHRLTKGRRVGRRCVRPSPRLRRRRSCTRATLAGTLVRNGRAGANTTPFSGRLGRRALRPGSYRATLAATDAAGNASRPRTLTFRVVSVPRRR